MAGFDASGSTLAAEVLSFPGLLAQQGASAEASTFTFQVDDEDSAEQFELRRADTLHFIGLMNADSSQPCSSAREELRELLSRLERGAVEGLTQRLFLALRRREMAREGERGEARGNSGRRELQRQLSMPPASKEQSTPRLRSTDATPRKVEDIFRKLKSQNLGRETLKRREPKAEDELSQSNAASTASHGSPRLSGPLGVFRRLTAASSLSNEERQKSLSLLASAPPMAPLHPIHPGVSSGEASARSTSLLEQVLAARQQSTARMIADELASQSCRSARVSEAQAQEIFDRLCRAGREQTIRRRVYTELGLLVEQTQKTIPVPRVPHAQYKGGIQPQGCITDRLYRDGLDRKRRLNELVLHAPAPTFRPQLISAPLGNDDPHYAAESAYSRLFRDHELRKRRQEKRKDQEEHLKYTFRPDISSSQATGPQIQRSSGGATMSRAGIISPAASRQFLMTNSSMSSGMADAAVLYGDMDGQEYEDMNDLEMRSSDLCWNGEFEGDSLMRGLYVDQATLPEVREEDEGLEEDEEEAQGTLPNPVNQGPAISRNQSWILRPNYPSHALEPPPPALACSNAPSLAAPTTLLQTSTSTSSDSAFSATAQALSEASSKAVAAMAAQQKPYSQPQLHGMNGSSRQTSQPVMGSHYSAPSFSSVPQTIIAVNQAHHMAHGTPQSPGLRPLVPPTAPAPTAPGTEGSVVMRSQHTTSMPHLHVMASPKASFRTTVPMQGLSPPYPRQMMHSPSLPGLPSPRGGQQSPGQPFPGRPFFQQSLGGVAPQPQGHQSVVLSHMQGQQSVGHPYPRGHQSVGHPYPHGFQSVGHPIPQGYQNLGPPQFTKTVPL